MGALRPTRSHEYSFSLYDVPTLDQMIEELQRAAAILGGDSTVRFKVTDGQRDGYSIQATVRGPV